MEEIWKDIPNFENKFQISNLGNLRHNTRGEWKLRKNTNKKGSYFNVVLVDGSYKKSEKIHRLVAKAFIPNPENKPMVNHINGNKQDNRVENLEWVTAKENFNHSKKNLLWKYNNPYKTIPVCQFSLNGEFIAEYKTCKDASKVTGVCARNILQVANKTPFNKKGNLRKQAGGYIWKKSTREVV